MAKTKDKKKENENNIEMEVDGSTLTLTVDLDTELRESESGKSTIVADTKNFMNIPDAGDDFEYGIKMIVTKRPKRKKKD